VRIEVQKRFLDAVSLLTKGSPANFRIGLAVSGGPDSIALLLLAHEAFQGRICAATVDHGLRPEAADEALFVASICSKYDIQHSILTPETPITGNIQSAARTARYALLERWADMMRCDYIATAHHADDQLETVLMRLARGSGADGMAGVRRRNGRIIRPLLGFTKDELIMLCNAANINPVQDPSNADTGYDRVRMRQWLASAPNPFSAASASRTANAISDASDALNWTAQHFANTHITGSKDGYHIDPQILPREILRRLLVIVIKEMDPDISLRGDAVERSLDALIAGDKISIGNIIGTGGLLWHFMPAPPRKNIQKSAE
jgi:tRNA(Ile)-lysidine synthase